ncbi:MAG: LytTR family DNA-binding domain-containing protein [Ruminococcus sp.]|nr:LytTR family DNA-binding domain-containing protein [Ruminococcus sp.]
MIRIAIVDDEPEQIQSIEKMVLDFFEQKNIKTSIKSYTNGSDLLNDTDSYAIIFLDIQMPDKDGIETAEQLRQRNKRAALFFVTSYQDYIQKSMTIHPFAFTTKPLTKEVLYRNLNDYLSYTDSVRKKKSKEKCLIHTTDGLYVQLALDDILYFHYWENRLVRVVTTSRKIYRTNDSISNIYAELNATFFIMPSQSFIVNLHHIRELDGVNKKIVMKNGDPILIPRRKYKEVIEIMNLYIANEED